MITYHSFFDISVSTIQAACTCEVNFCCSVHNPDLDIHDGHELKLGVSLLLSFSKRSLSAHIQPFSAQILCE